MKIYEKKNFKLFSDRFIEGNKKTYALGSDSLILNNNTRITPFIKNNYPRVYSNSPMVDLMYKISLQDHEKCVVNKKTYLYGIRSKINNNPECELTANNIMPDNKTFWAGYGFNTLIYTRDTSYSSFLGTSFILPDVVNSHIKYTRKLRKHLGLKVSEEHFIPIEDIPQKVLDISEQEYMDKYNTNSYTRRTDDIVWVIGIWDYYCVSQDEKILKWMIETFEYFDKNFYSYFFDEEDNLYRGQPSFIDVGGSGYPDYTIQDGIMIKALSTNCLYAAAFDRIEKACKKLGLTKKAEKYKNRSLKLKQSIREKFVNENGYYGYFINKDGYVENRRELLGSAFLILFDILSKEEQNIAIDGYKEGTFGRPLIWPFYKNETVYHNNSTWPFADTLFSFAEFKYNRKKETLLSTLAKLCRHSLKGNFNELLEYKTGNFVGCESYIWSTASYLAVIFKMIAGIRIDYNQNIFFKPFLPEELGKRFIIDNIKIGDMKINLNIEGNGSEIDTFKVDGNLKQKPFIRCDQSKHNIDIKLK